jgi:hypothetical protein
VHEVVLLDLVSRWLHLLPALDGPANFCDRYGSIQGHGPQRTGFGASARVFHLGNTGDISSFQGHRIEQLNFKLSHSPRPVAR